MKPFFQTAALACAVALSGCAMMPGGGGGGRAGGSTPAPAERATAGQQDAHFLRQAAHSGHAEVESSQLAQSKASNPQVRAFAARMIQDHTRVNAELAQLARSKGIDVPTQPSPAQRSRIQALAALSGDAFDRQYIDQMGVMAHENSVSLFRLGATNSRDPDVKAFASRTLPALNMHLDMAKQFQAAMGR